MRRMVLGGALVCSVLAVMLSGCSHVSSVATGKRGPYASHDRDGHGPPPHAPAHGHRRKQHGSGGDIELAFDSDLGVYVVIDLPNHYYWDSYYLRIEDGSWYVSSELEGHRKPRSSDSLPPGLRKKYAKQGKAKKARARGAAPSYSLASASKPLRTPAHHCANRKWDRLRRGPDPSGSTGSDWAGAF